MRIAGGLFAIALPSGEWACLLRGDCIQTRQGRVERPKGDGEPFDVGYLDITNAPVFRIAGQAQVEPTDPHRGTWEWSQAEGWRQRSQDAPGTYPVMYDSQGFLHVATPEHNGSQGWRYEGLNGEIVTGDDTLNDQRSVGLALGIRDLWEYSHFAGVTIGQGDPPIGCHVLIDGTRRLLEPGGCHFIRVRYLDGKYAVSMTKLAEREAVIEWLTRADLLGLPVIGAQPQPVPQPQPEPVPMPDIPDQSSTVAAVRAKYPTPLGPTHAACLLEIARTIGQGAGLLRKDSGSNILLPDGTRVAQDIIVFKDGQGFDCLGSGETLATPQWSGPIDGSPFPASRYYKVSAGTPEEPGEPEDPEPIPAGVMALLLEMRADLKALRAHFR